MITLCMTAATLRVMLLYVDPVGGPRIAADDDSLAEALVQRIREAVGEEHGSRYVRISFSREETELLLQFAKVAENIAAVFDNVASLSRRLLSDG